MIESSAKMHHAHGCCTAQQRLSSIIYILSSISTNVDEPRVLNGFNFAGPKLLNHIIAKPIRNCTV